MRFDNDNDRSFFRRREAESDRKFAQSLPADTPNRGVIVGSMLVKAQKLERGEMLTAREEKCERLRRMTPEQRRRYKLWNEALSSPEYLEWQRRRYDLGEDDRGGGVAICERYVEERMATQ